MEVIDVNRKILSVSKELEITNEAIVPDVKPDIVNIISNSGLAYCHKEEQSNGVFKLDGNAEITVVYLSSEGDTRSMHVGLDFSNKLEDSRN